MEAYFNRHGVAIGLIRSNHIRYLVHGYADLANSIKVSTETRFEIGSVTKPLTAFLFAGDVASGTLRLNTPVSSLLPDVANALKQITLAELITHQSGLPRLPPNLVHIGVLNPYADYDTEALIQAVSAVASGQKSFRYSNFGYGILTLAAESRYADNYTMLMKTAVFPVLNMQNADIAGAGRVFRHLANGHVSSGDKTRNWQFDSMAGAGGVIASIRDMAQMIAAIFRGYETSPALKVWLTPLSHGEHSMAMGWMISEDGSYFHGGQTLGFSAYAGFNLATQAGVVILTNIARDVSVAGGQILNQLNKQQQDK
jgi:CubicO group peptidase (beta-lactamase class C family)